MPLLQHALLELWNRRHGRWLQAEEYRAIGGVQGAIAQHGRGRSTASCAAPDRSAVRDIFVRLTRLDDDGAPRRASGATPAGGCGWTSWCRPAATAAATKALVARLADRRLVVTGRDAATGRTEVEVAHEALDRGRGQP